MRDVRWAAALAAVCALGWPAAGQQPAGGQTAGQPQQPPLVFRSTVDVVAVDVSVVDRNGRPVEDLKPENFTLTVDGKARRIVSAEYVAIGAAPAAAAPRPIDRYYSSNERAETGRLFLIVVDQGNIRKGGGRALLAAAGRFLDRLRPSDRVALSVIPELGVTIGFTANHRLVREALAGVVGRAEHTFGFYNLGLHEAVEIERSNPYVVDTVTTRECVSADAAVRASGATEVEVCRDQIRDQASLMMRTIRQQTRASIAALEALVESLRTLETPSTLVLISEGLIVEGPLSDVSPVGSLASSSRVSIYALRPDTSFLDEAFEGRRSRTTDEDNQMRSQGLEALVDAGRGAIFSVVGTGEAAFERIALEVSGFYLLGFEPQPGDRDNQAHKIRVQVGRRAVTVRARPEFKVSRFAADAPTGEAAIAGLLRSPFQASELPVRLATYTLKDSATSRLRVIVSADIDQAATAPAELLVGYVLLGERGRLAVNSVQRVTLEPADRRGPAPLSYRSALLVDPGEYTLKFAAVSTSGRRGSVEHAVSARLTPARPLELGDLILAGASTAQTGVVTPGADPTMAGNLLAGYVELYAADAEPLQQAAVTIDVAQTETGPALVTGATRLEQQDRSTRREAQGRVPLGLLPPGDYVARVAVSVAGRPVGRVARPFRVARPAVGLPGAGAPAGRGAATTAAGAFRAAVAPFRREDALAPDVLRGFLDRLVESHAPQAAPVRAAIEVSRDGRFEAVSVAESAQPGDRLAAAFLSGLAALAGGSLEAAAGQFRAALQISSEFAPATFYLGACYAAGGREREAVGAWNTALVHEEDSPHIYRFLGDALLRLNDGEWAVEILREASENWPEDGHFRRSLAAALAMAGREAEALASLRNYLDGPVLDRDMLLFAIRLIYEAHVAGRSIGAGEDDRALIARYAAQYAAANGPDQDLVAQWVRYVQEGRE